MGLGAPDHTVRYGTVLSRTLFPGTSCQATIASSLRSVTPFVGAKTSQAALNLAPFYPDVAFYRVFQGTDVFLKYLERRLRQKLCLMVNFCGGGCHLFLL